MSKYWPNWIHLGNKNKLLKIIFYLQLIIFKFYSRINPRLIDYEFCKGSNCINFTHKCVAKIFAYLEKDKKYISRYKWTNCADEIFYHIILNMVDGLEIINESLRYVNWADGPEYPKILKGDDYEKINNSDKLFARKFDENIDNIYKIIGKK